MECPIAPASRPSPRRVAAWSLGLILTTGASAGPAASAFETPVSVDLLDPAAFTERAGGAETPVAPADGPRHALWTQTTAPEWDGVSFGDTKQAGARHLRIGFKGPVPVGTVITLGGGRLSVLAPAAAYPGRLGEEADWVPADRLKGGRISRDEAGRQDYVTWVLPSGTTTRALRFTHEAAPTDPGYAGWLGGAFVLAARFADVAPQATASAGSRGEAAGLINDGSNNNTWVVWDNGEEGAARAITPAHPGWVILTWPRAQRLRGLDALGAGFGAAEVQAYRGPEGRHPREATEADWAEIRGFDGIDSQYPRTLGVNGMDFGRDVVTRAVRLRITGATKEGHPHLIGKTRGGRRVWLGELQALRPLDDADLSTAALPSGEESAPRPPIPVRFALEEPGYVTLVIEDSGGRRVRNLVSETPFPAGPNVAWWDGLDDLRRDEEAARHGLYQIPSRFVPPGTYRVRGLARRAIDLRYEFSAYNAGRPPWPTADHAGGWLTNHTPPSAALFVPAATAPGGTPLVFLGSYVSEGGDGLAWVDLDGCKQGGRGTVGGAWTGASHLARDDGKDAVPGVFAYAGAAWEGELRLTALTRHGDRAAVKYHFEGGKAASGLSGLAVRDGLIVCSLPKRGRLLLADARAGTVLGESPLDDPRGLAFDAGGRLLALSGRRLLRYRLPEPLRTTAALPTPEVVVADGLEDPRQLSLDARGNLYVSDRGGSHQVKVFAPDGKPLRAIGAPGAPKAGPYDPGHMNNPEGVAIDGRDHLWVAEEDFQPKRVSVWTLDGEPVDAFYGPSEYGGGGTLDPRDPTRFYYHGMEFRLDWEKGSDRLARVFFRPGPGDLGLPDGPGAGGQPETPLYRDGRRYFTNCYTSNPTNGASIATLWLDRGGIAVPVAALGRANDWGLLKEAAFRPKWPAGVDPDGEYGSNQAHFAWSDADGDAHVQPAEVTITRGSVGGITVMPDLAFVASRVGDRAMRFAPAGFTARDVPLYDLKAGEELVVGAQPPASSGGDQALVAPDGRVVLTVAPGPFAPQSVGGAAGGKPTWSYPSLWPGLHASHESPPPDRPGELIGTTRLLGGFVTPRRGDAGPIWAINGNMGNVYLFTADGLFVATLFNDVRQGKSWAMPAATRGMTLDGVTLHDENFWPSITQAEDGRVFLVDGNRTSLVRVDGLETVRRLPETSLVLTAADLEAARAHVVEAEARRQKGRGQGTLAVAIRAKAPVVDGRLDDWSGAEWADIDKAGVAAFFDSRSKPYDVTAAVAVAGDRLFVAFRTGDPELLRNSGELPVAPFKTGGALDLMIGADPAADPARDRPAPGDARLLVGRAGGKPFALLYRAVVPGTKAPVPFSSPWRTITLDRVDDVADQVRLASNGGDYELSIPLEALGLAPAPGRSIRADVGLLRGDGFQTLRRVYWNNKATGITADVPSEAMLTPALWGRWRFAAAGD